MSLPAGMTIVSIMTRKAETRTVTVKIEGRGWVRNASDGSVEAVFSGPAKTVADMLERCKDGPPDAKVTAVTITDEGGAPPSGFRVIGTNWR